MEKENRKLQRIDADIFRIIATYISEQGIAAEIVEVKTTADLSECKIFVSTGVEELERASGHLRSEIAQRLSLRKTPKLKFIHHKGKENASRVEELLQQIKANSNN